MIHPIVSPRAQVRMMGLRSSRVDRVSETVTSEWSFAQRPSPFAERGLVLQSHRKPHQASSRGFQQGRIRSGIVIKGRVFCETERQWRFHDYCVLKH